MEKATFLIICFSLLLSLNLIAQKHNFHVTYGGALTGNYEFPLSYSEESGSQINFKTSVGERYHVGYTRAPDASFQTKLFLGASLVMLSGKKSNLFEVSFGLGNGWRKKNNVSDGTYLLLLANIGYRFESDAFLFRVGVGFPELLYLGVGIRI